MNVLVLIPSSYSDDKKYLLYSGFEGLHYKYSITSHWILLANSTFLEESLLSVKACFPL